MRALVGPPVMMSAGATGEPRLLIRLLIQARALPSETTNHAIFEQYDSLAIKFVDAIQQATPGLSREEAFWRYSFAIGAMFYIVSDSDQQYHRLERISNGFFYRRRANGLCNPNDPDEIVRQLVNFITAGIAGHQAG